MKKNINRIICSLVFAIPTFLISIKYVEISRAFILFIIKGIIYLLILGFIDLIELLIKNKIDLYRKSKKRNLLFAMISIILSIVLNMFNIPVSFNNSNWGIPYMAPYKNHYSIFDFEALSYALKGGCNINWLSLLDMTIWYAVIHYFIINMIYIIVKFIMYKINCKKR